MKRASKHQPEGWQLVPNEATVAMVKAGLLACQQVEGIPTRADLAAVMWRAMFDAAPTAA